MSIPLPSSMHVLVGMESLVVGFVLVNFYVRTKTLK